MTRAAVITAHVVALPAAVLLSAALALLLPSHRGIDVQLHDTFFVVAHFHATVILATSVAVATFVAYRYGGINVPLVASWAFLIVHVASAAAQRLAQQGLAPADAGMVTSVLPSHPGMAYLYIGTFLGGFCAVILGIAVSLWTGICRRGLTWSA